MEHVCRRGAAPSVSSGWSHSLLTVFLSCIDRVIRANHKAADSNPRGTGSASLCEGTRAMKIQGGGVGAQRHAHKEPSFDNRNEDGGARQDGHFGSSNCHRVVAFGSRCKINRCVELIDCYIVPAMRYGSATIRQYRSGCQGACDGTRRSLERTAW